MLIDRMALADISNPRLIAQAVIRQLDIRTSTPTPVESVAEAVGISSIQPIRLNGFEGALITNADKMDGIILCRSDVPYQRQRFTISHELGHYLNPWHVPSENGFECTSANMRAEDGKDLSGRPKWEAEANMFAAELLMPTATFGDTLKKIRSLSLERTIELARSFNVSMQACARRIVGFNTEDCAYIFSKDGIIKQIYRSAEFPYIAPSIGSALPPRGLSRRFSGPSESCSDMDASESSYWSNDSRARRDYFEQVMIQSEGWRLTLLVSEEAEEDDESEEVGFGSGRY